MKPLTLDYTEWMRYEAAICRAHEKGNHITPDRIWPQVERCRRLINEGKIGRGSDAALCCEVATALGLDRRRRLEWDNRTDSEYRHADIPAFPHRPAVALPDPYGNGWFAEVEGHARVANFPTRESAIACLERILGRAEFDHMFAGVAP